MQMQLEDNKELAHLGMCSHFCCPKSQNSAPKSEYEIAGYPVFERSDCYPISFAVTRKRGRKKTALPALGQSAYFHSSF
jgi:hypothetical protein